MEGPAPTSSLPAPGKVAFPPTPGTFKSSPALPGPLFPTSSPHAPTPGHGSTAESRMHHSETDESGR